jgi:hypothetical protein
MKARNLFVLTALVACTSGDAAAPAGTVPAVSTSPVTPGALPCDVDDVLARGCRQCHASPPQFGAPMPLVTLADLHAPAKSDPTQSVFQRVGARIHDDARPMPQPPNPRLDAKDTSTLDAWIAAGAPAGADGACTTAPTPPPPPVNPLSCTPDVHMKPATPFAMPADSDDRYACYGFDVPVPAPGKRHMIAIAPHLDNTKIVHHAVLFQAPTSVSPTPLPCDFGAIFSWRMVYAWAPGSQPLELPPEAGFPLEGVAHYAVQVHYSNPSHLAAQSDATGFDFCTTPTLRTYDADALVFGDENFTIPPHGTLTRQCDTTWPASAGAVHVFAAMPHMHQIGTWIKTVLLAPTEAGAPVDLGTRNPWDFGNQIYVPLTASLAPGQVVRTTCKWTNPQNTAVSFGPFTTDEMCNSYTLYYPRITAPTWTWNQPVDKGTCTTIP